MCEFSKLIKKQTTRRKVVNNEAAHSGYVLCIMELGDLSFFLSSCSQHKHNHGCGIFQKRYRHSVRLFRCVVFVFELIEISSSFFLTFGVLDCIRICRLFFLFSYIHKVFGSVCALLFLVFFSSTLVFFLSSSFSHL